MKRFLKYFVLTILVLIGVVAGLLIYAHFVEPFRLVINEQTLNVKPWSRELNGFKVVAVSDIHGGSRGVTEDRLRFLTEQVNWQNPDIIVLPGDFVSQVSGRSSGLKMPLETIVENIKGMRAKYGVYVAIGNHDWWYDEKKFRVEIEKVGFKVLDNETASFEANGKTVTILGVEDYWKRRKVEVADTLAKIQPTENIIAVAHNPDSFDFLPANIALTVAGHTHGGQALVPLIGVPFPVAKREYTAGSIVKDGRNLFVTSGFGTSGPPIRFMVPPEIAVLTLNSAE
jgi:predicted MPP superfamily phosphohydrolase